MIRHCDGTDPNLLDDSVTATPCSCGLTFDDVHRCVIYPHAFIPTRAEREALAAMLDSIVVERV